MIYSNITNPPAKFTASMYGKTVTIELDHSDFDLTELMEVFKGLAIASGFANDSWDSVIKQLSADIHDYEREDLKEKLEAWKFEEDYTGQFEDWKNETPPLEDDEDSFFGPYDSDEKRMDIIGQNGNEGTHYGFDWDNTYEGETNDILTNINDSIQIIKDRMEDIDMRMDNIDEQLDILNADVANIEYSIENPIKEKLINALAKYSNEVKEKHVPIKDFDVVDMESGEVSATNEVSNDGGFDGKGFKTPKVLGKWQTDNKTKEVVKLDKTKVRKGKIKDLKK